MPSTIAPRRDRDARRTAIAVLVGGITVALSSTTVSIALHDLAIDHEVGVSTVQWVITAYLLALCMVIPVVGWLQSRFGGKRLWIGALLLFLLGSVLCSLAWDAQSLVAARAVQGMGAGVVTPLVTTILLQATPEHDRARLTSIVALSTAVGPILGPVVGGLILGVADWRWLFLINVPLCLAGLFLAWRLIPGDEPTRSLHLDFVGLGLLPPALVGLLWGLSNLSGGGGIAETEVLAPMIGGTIMLAAFVLWALYRRGAALVDLGALRSRATAAATATLFLSGATLHGAMLLLPLYWQQLRDADPIEAGLLLIPQGVGSLLSRAVAIRVMERNGVRVVSMIGFALTGLGTLPFAFAGADTPIGGLTVALFARGLGIGMVVIPLITVAFVGLQREEVPHVSIGIRLSQQVGGSVGVALLAVILASATESSGSVMSGFHVAFWWAAGFAGIAMLLSVALPRWFEPTRHL